MATRAFLSFVEEDLNLVNLFRGQAKNERFDLEFDDYSIKEPFDSRNADYIRRGINDRLPWDMKQIVQTMEQLVEKYRKGR